MDGVADRGVALIAQHDQLWIHSDKADRWNQARWPAARLLGVNTSDESEAHGWAPNHRDTLEPIAASEAAARVLVVTASAELGEPICRWLALHGWSPRRVDTASEVADELDAQGTVALVMIVEDLPDAAATLLCSRLKTARPSLPVILVHKTFDEQTVISGFNGGADDVITGPHTIQRVLMARIAAVLTHGDPLRPAPSVRDIRVGPIRLSPDRHEVAVDDQPVDLTLTQFRILALLMRRPGWLFSAQQIAEAMGESGDTSSDSVRSHIYLLRRRLGSAGAMIQTVRGLGYRLRT